MLVSTYARLLYIQPVMKTNFQTLVHSGVNKGIRDAGSTADIRMLLALLLFLLFLVLFGIFGTFDLDDFDDLGYLLWSALVYIDLP